MHDLENFWPEWKGAINLTNSPTKTVINTKPSGRVPEGRKDDGDKLRMDLLDPIALEGLSAVLTFGAKKYAAHNWRGGLAYSRLIGAALRHLFAVVRGEDLDPESGLPHVDHLGCCWMFLSHMMKTRKDLDDRFSTTMGK